MSLRRPSRSARTRRLRRTLGPAGPLVCVTLIAMVAACRGATSEEEAGEDTGAQVAEATESVAMIEGDATAGTRIAVIRSARFALEGARVAELVIGKRYALVLRRSVSEPRDGLQVRELVDLRAVKHVVGTLADDVNDPEGMILTSVHGKSYAVHGDAAAAFREIRASLPAHDYTRTLFEANVVEDRSPSTRFTWLDYEPVPRVRCTQKDSPGVHLDLVDVKPDESVLDGFVKTPMGGHEARYGAHAECKRDPAGAIAYGCILDVGGDVWGRASLVPVETGTFDVEVTRREGPKLTFVCAMVARASLLPASED